MSTDQEHARVIMESGGKWTEQMRGDCGYLWTSEYYTDEPPDLTDGPTCRALQSQLVALIVVHFPGVRVVVSHLHTGPSSSVEWVVRKGSFTLPLFTFTGSEPEALAAAWSWFAGVRDAR